MLRDPRPMIDLLRPLMHHRPMQMLHAAEYRHFLVDDARLRMRDEASECLRHLELNNELDLRMLNLMTAWQPLTSQQRQEMLSFFERSMLLCRIAQRPNVMLISARIRSVASLSAEVDSVVSSATRIALYLLPVNHIGIIPQTISRALSKKLTGSRLCARSGGDTLLVHRQHATGPCCSVHLFPCSDLVSSSLPDSSALVAQVTEQFSCVLCVASCDFGLFKFMVKCTDDMMDSCSFGTRFQSWSLRLSPSRRWAQFRHSGLDAEAFEESSLTDALCRNMHETVAGISALLRYNHLSRVASSFPRLSLFFCSLIARFRPQDDRLLRASKPHFHQPCVGRRDGHVCASFERGDRRADAVERVD